jgi:hypothetical protein
MPEDEARYVVRDHPTLGRRLWWAPPGGAAWDRLPLRPGGPADDGVGARHVAEAILVHATGDFAVAREHALAFRAETLDALVNGQIELRADVVHAWLRLNGIPPAPGWGPLGPAPVVECMRNRDGTERYRVSLDGWEILRVDAESDRAVRVEVADVDGPDRTRWSGDVVVADAADGHRPLASGRRVSAESLPFGGWAVQVDGFDVAIIERHATSAVHARVAVYDRGLDSEFQRFDEPVAYREPPSERLSVAERLARFHGTLGAERVLGR